MQKGNRRGFTLIELLAVIVILAIIALIAVPVIMNVITKARISAFEDSAYGIVKAGELYYSNQLLEPEGMTDDQEFTVNGGVFKNSEGDTLEVSGSIPSSGKVTVTSDGEVALAISNGEYCIRKATTESSVKAEKLSDLGGVCNYKTVFTTTSEGTEVPACITNNTLCDVTAAGNDGIKVGVKVNESETKDFYVMKDESNELTLIMSENLGEFVSWYESGHKTEGSLFALKELEERTSNWINIPSKTYTLKDDNSTPVYSDITRTARARLITKTEANTLGCTSSSGSCPTWLYSNLDGSYERLGYWTSTSCLNSGYALAIYYSGSISGNDSLTDINDFGIRPVITISKTIL